MDDRPTVYLVHGLLETGHSHYAKQIPEWRDRFRLVPVDLPGHGRCAADARDPYYATAFAYLSTVCGRFGRGHVVAASYLGAPLAVRLAGARPELVDSLVLHGFVPDTPKTRYDEWYSSFHFLPTLADHHAVLRDGYERLHGPRWRQTLECVLGGIDEGYDDDVLVSAGTLRSLGRPVLLVNGGNRAPEREAAVAFPDPTAGLHGHVIPDAGHIPGRDNPAEFSRVVAEFLNSVAAVRADGRTR